MHRGLEAELQHAVADYYSGKLRQHGATPRGVDWNSEAGQRLRYEQLARLLPADDFSVCDLGCGYGGFYDYLARTHTRFRYLGVDLSPDMVAAARQLHAGRPDCRFEQGGEPEAADFVVASGIFNVKLATPTADWEQFVQATIARMRAASRRGLAFNCLSSCADAHRQRADLHYADPARYLGLALGYARHVALLHDYGLYEFTLIVRIEDPG